MFALPRVPYSLQKKKQDIVKLRGINYSDSFKDGDLAAALNLSARRWPYISTRRAREKQGGIADCTALTAWDQLITVRGSELFYGDKSVGAITPGEKQFAFVNTQLVIWPDKVYLDLKTQTIKPLAAKTTITGATFGTASVSVKVSDTVDFTKLFKVGDTITISGCANEHNNRDITITNLTKNKITTTANAFQEAREKVPITFERKIPDLDYICESENRLWGCSTEKQTIYASALGDPSNFFTYQGLSTDSYTVAVGTEGAFTGCCKLASSVLFWKETKLHKMLGSFPAEYALYTYDIEGLKKDCHKSLKVINETLFYMGIHGVYIYNGGTPALISTVFGENEYEKGSAGTDGDSYFLSVKDGSTNRLFVYETREGIWISEDNSDIVDFARIGKKMYALDRKTGEVWLADAGHDDPDVPWIAQFCPFYETIDGRKSYSRLKIRVEVPRGSYAIAEIRMDGGIWRQVGRVVGDTRNTQMFVLPPLSCDKFEVKLSGKGPVTILGVQREYSLGGER